MMTKKILTTGMAAVVSLSAMAQQTVGQEAIKQLCGCFAVTFNYAETFTNDTTTTYVAKPMNHKTVIEYAFPIMETETKIVIQHLLVIPDGKGTVIKHWREDWQYEQTDTWQYSNNNEWTKVTLAKDAVKGKWTQSVWEVTDAPRYTGTSEWVYTNNQLFWLNTTDSPLPRREFTKRNDYNILQRTNRIIVSPEGYMHEQDNKKVLRTTGQQDRIIAEEKGYNQYVRMPDADCASTQAFWTKEKAAFWQDVVEVWDDKMNLTERVHVESQLDGRMLYQALDELEEENLAEGKRKIAIAALLERHITAR